MMNITPIDPIVLAALVGLSLAGAVDVAINGHITWRTALWAALFLGGFWVNYNNGGNK